MQAFLNVPVGGQGFCNDWLAKYDSTTGLGKTFWKLLLMQFHSMLLIILIWITHQQEVYKTEGSNMQDIDKQQH